MKDIDFKEEYQIRRIVSFLYHNVLRDYMAPSNEEAVLSGLYKFYTDDNFVMIDKEQFKMYQELEKLALATSALKI